MSLKVLCLHGYRQDARIFREKSGGFRKMLRNKVEFTIIDAPHIIPEGEQNPDNSDSFRSWWFSETDPFDAFYSIKDSEIDKGFGDSIDLVKRTVQAEGPFDGILGFSQGASMSAIVCSLQQAGIVDSGFRFAILVSGFKSKTASHAKHYAEQIELPTLHVIGETDRIIEQERSLDLASCFVDPVIIKHPGGHQVPSSSSLKREYFAFLKQFLPEDIL